MKTSVSPTQIVSFEGQNFQVKNDLLAVEEPLEIRLLYNDWQGNQEKNLTITMRTPGNDFELALGFLFAEGIIQNYQQVKQIYYCENVKEEERGNVLKVSLLDNIFIDFSKLNRHFYTSSSCGVCGKTSIDCLAFEKPDFQAPQLKIDAQILPLLPHKLQSVQSIFNHTGGLHATALFDLEGNLIVSREDVGRHNAFDKVIGNQVFSNKTPLRENIILVSGRLSYELVQKAIMAEIPILVAVGAPSSLAVDLARRFEITLIGFLRQNHFNVYAGQERLIL
jgi:FdhD protein